MKKDLLYIFTRIHTNLLRSYWITDFRRESFYKYKRNETEIYVAFIVSLISLVHFGYYI